MVDPSTAVSAIDTRELAGGGHFSHREPRQPPNGLLSGR
jgi:hypothetical protein